MADQLAVGSPPKPGVMSRVVQVSDAMAQQIAVLEDLHSNLRGKLDELLGPVETAPGPEEKRPSPESCLDFLDFQRERLDRVLDRIHQQVGRV